MKFKVHPPHQHPQGENNLVREALIKKLNCSAKRGNGNVGVSSRHREQGPGSLEEEESLALACTCGKCGLPTAKGPGKTKPSVPPAAYIRTKW